MSSLPSPLKSPAARADRLGSGGKFFVRLEGAVAVAQDDRYLALKLIDRGQINLAIAVKVAGDDRNRVAGHRILHVRGEGAGAIAQKNRNGIVGRGDCQVKIAIAVEIGGDHILRRDVGGIIGLAEMRRCNHS